MNGAAHGVAKKELELALRPASPDEADALTALALRSKASWGYTQDFMDACRAELTYTSHQIANEDEVAFVVCQSHKIVVGFYALSRSLGDSYELAALFVDPEHLRQGVGETLLGDAANLAAREGARRLVIQGDPNAEGFYLSAGAVRAGYRASESIPGRMLPLFVLPLSG